MAQSVDHLDDWVEIRFKSQSRGGDFREIRLTKDSIYHFSGNRRNHKAETQKKCLSRKDIKQIDKALDGLERADFSSLESPTNKRAYDGAAHSEIVILIQGQPKDHYFDDELPHASLQPLLQVMLGLVDP